MLKRTNCIFRVVFPVVMIASSSLFAQKKPEQKEVINITSSFKPSIVRTGKIEFYAAPVPKDTTAYQFRYPQPSFEYATSMTGFSISPLAFVPDSSLMEETLGYAKIGFGNLRTPFASLGYQRVQATDRFTVNLDHFASRGKLPDQQFSTSSLGLTYRKRFSENQSMSFFGGVARNDFRRYGFDHNQFSFTKQDIQQRFNRYHLGGEYRLVAGESANTVMTPFVRMDYLSSNKVLGEFGIKAGLPITYQLNDKVTLSVSPMLDFSSLNKGSDLSQAGMYQVPIRGALQQGAFSIRAGLVPYYASAQFKLLPDLFASYRLPSGLRLKAGIENTLGINPYRELTETNPFILPVQAITPYRSSAYFAGFDWVNSKGFQFRFKSGFLHFMNQPLFVNLAGNTEKDMAVLFESSLQALHAEAGFDLVISNSLKLNGSARLISFQKQADNLSPFGLLPFEAKLGLDWKPLPAFLVRMRVLGWQGATYQTASGTELRLKGALDAGLQLEYGLDKKWALWMDLNNIANTPYQRWFGYTAFGFNAIAGFRFLFNN
jgi:hypothetical protein